MNKLLKNIVVIMVGWHLIYVFPPSRNTDDVIILDYFKSKKECLKRVKNKNYRCIKAEW